MILLDTCALLWWTLDPEKLSEAASTACDQIPDNGGIISAISIWEIGIKVRKGKLDIGLSITEYASRLSDIANFRIIPVDEKIWIENILLEWAHRDPADRTIVATAKLAGVPIVTKDQIIREFYPETIW